MLFLPLRIAWKVVSLLLTAAVAYLVLTAVQVALAARASSNPSAYRDADAIAVDGPPATSSKLGPDLSRRLATAATFARAGLAPHVVVVLVTPPGSNSASAVAQAGALLQAHGVRTGSFTITGSTTGTEGLRTIRTVLGGHSPSAIVVTDAINALWTKGAAASAGLTPQVAPAEGSKVALWQEIGPLARETSGVAVGRIFGDLRAGWAAD